MSGKLAIFIVLVSAGIFNSCSHPVTPPPTITVQDSVTITAPKIEYVKDTISFFAHTNFNASNDSFKWIFSDSTIISSDSNLKRIFLDSGKYILHLLILKDTTLCSIFDTIQIFDTTHHDTIKPPPPPDTTSHNFTWTQFTDVGNENNMTGCWVFGQNDIFAVNGNLQHYDGNSWTSIVVKDDAGNNYYSSLSGSSIFGFSDNDLWLIHANIALHYKGTTPAHTYSTYYMNHGSIYSGWGTSSNDMYFVGDSGLIAHFDGTNWTKMNSGTTKSLGSIWGTSDNDIWVAGFNPETAESAVLHFNGNEWTEIENSIGNIGVGEDAIAAVWNTDSLNHKIVYCTGSHVWKQVDGGVWVSDSGRIGNSVGGNQYVGIYFVHGDSANDVMVAGESGFVSHWNGGSWNQFKSLYSPGDLSFIVSGFSKQGSTACVVGQRNGTSWIAIGQRQ